MKDALQEQMAATRRRHILEAAARVFAAKGFHPTTIKDIAREAGIADGTIYNYFENKTALLLGIFDTMREAALLTAEIGALSTDDMRAFITAYLRHPLMTLRTDNFDLFRVVVSEMLVNRDLRTLYTQRILEPTLALARPAFEAWVAQGKLKAVDVDLLLRVVSGMMFGLIFQYLMDDHTLEAKWEQLPELLTTMILDGLEVNRS